MNRNNFHSNFIKTNQNSTKSSANRFVVKLILISNRRFDVDAKYHVPLIDICKQFNSKQYEPTTRRWSLDLNDYFDFVNMVRKNIQDAVIDGLPSFITIAFKKNMTKKDLIENEQMVTEENQAVAILQSSLPYSLISCLLPYQKIGVAQALKFNGRVLLADDMGLGKSLQALSIATAYLNTWPLLIICPSSVRYTWREQILKWLSEPIHLTNDQIFIPANSNDVNFRHITKIIIISYDLVSKVLKTMPTFQIVIVDESHFLKNYKTARTKNTQPVLVAAKHVILLSGTPALSRPVELYPQLSSVRPDIFKQQNYHEFGLRYCNGRERPWGWDYSGCSNMSELQIFLKEVFLIRRVKKEVMKDLPLKRREMIILDPNVCKKKKKVVDKENNQLLKQMDLNNIENRGALLQYFHETATRKLPAIEQYILDLIEAGKKFIVFAHHSDILSCLSDTLSKKAIIFIRIDGRTQSEQRQLYCERFQADDSCRIALLSITAAGAGLNLTAANLVVFAELFWNPGILVQAEDRAYRIGQNDCVTVQYLIAENTSDDDLWPMIQNKLTVLTEAGLSKENFQQVDKTRIVSKQSESKEGNILDYMTDLTDWNDNNGNTIFKDSKPGKSEVRGSAKVSRNILNYLDKLDKIDTTEALSSHIDSEVPEKKMKVADGQDTLMFDESLWADDDFIINEDSVQKPKVKRSSSLFKNIKDPSFDTSSFMVDLSSSLLLVPESPEKSNSFEQQDSVDDQALFTAACDVEKKDDVLFDDDDDFITEENPVDDEDLLLMNEMVKMEDGGFIR